MAVRAEAKAGIVTSRPRDGFQWVVGIVASAQPGELAKAIATVMDDAGARQQAGENARKLVEQQFTWERIAASMEQQYEQLRG